MGSAEYVYNALGRRAATVGTPVETLVQLPLSVQPQLLLLRASLQGRMAHLTRTVPREAVALHMRRTDPKVWRAAAAVLDMPDRLGEYGAGTGQAVQHAGSADDAPAVSRGATVAHIVRRGLGRRVRGRRWPSRVHPERAPRCTLPSAWG